MLYDKSTIKVQHIRETRIECKQVEKLSLKCNVNDTKEPTKSTQSSSKFQGHQECPKAHPSKFSNALTVLAVWLLNLAGSSEY